MGQIRIEGPHGETLDVQVHSSNEFRKYVKWLWCCMQWLNKFKGYHARFRAELEFFEGNIPCAQPKRKAVIGMRYWIFGGVLSNGRIIIHAALNKYEKIATLTHELFHAVHSSAEKAAHSTAIDFMHKIYENYDLITMPANAPNFKNHGLNPNYISKSELTNALRYLVETASMFGVY